MQYDHAPKLASVNNYDADRAHSLRGGNGNRQWQRWTHGYEMIKEKWASVKLRENHCEISREPCHNGSLM